MSTKLCGKSRAHLGISVQGESSCLAASYQLEWNQPPTGPEYPSFHNLQRSLAALLSLWLSRNGSFFVFIAGINLANSGA